MTFDVDPEIRDRLKNIARNTPQDAGVYLWKDGENKIIYIGKAKHIRKRLMSYFAGTRDVKTTALIRHARSIETIILTNEYEALLLENTLIKQHSPKYNINLKDGKTYPLIRISPGEFPRVFRTRQVIEDGSIYFGPYTNVQSLDGLMNVIEKLFTLRKCKIFKKRKNPCMYYHIDRCKAPCCGKITAEEYKAHVEHIIKFLSGETERLSVELRKKMHEEAAALKFEEAARLRNAIKAIEELQEPQNAEDRDGEDRDYIDWAEEGILTAFSVFSMRGGRMTGRELFCSRSAAEENETLETFIAAYYSLDKPPPHKIFVRMIKEPSPALLRFFKETYGYTPELAAPNEKRHEAVLAMARQNSLEELRRRTRERGTGPALDELRAALELKSRPERIEGFDISHLNGKYPTASLVSFLNGAPDKKNYRHYKLRSVKGIIDDYAAIREVVHRRYSGLIKEGKDLPDLILVDGGAGQVSSAKEVLDKLGINADLAGLAKKEELIWRPGIKTPLRLTENSEALKILQYVRDETHRFAINLNKKLRSKNIYFKVLESVDGIGAARAAVLMKNYNSLENIAAAQAGEISRRCGISLNTAKAARAAARLALENAASNTQELAAYAAENTPEYTH